MTVEQELPRILGAWAVASTVVGAALTTSRRTRGFGRQTAAWGAVDGAIAVLGARRRTTRGATDPTRLRRVLLVNAGLDVGYLAGAAWLVRDGRWRGDGVAVAVQAAFLLVLDCSAAVRLQRQLRRG